VVIEGQHLRPPGHRLPVAELFFEGRRIMAKRAPKTHPLNARVPSSIVEHLDTLAKAVGKSRSAVVRALLLRATVADLPASWHVSDTQERALLAEVER
jgi:Ribbon-helix-helix protein, copG family